MAEVCSVVDVSQFAAGHSVDKCGFYGVSLLKYAGRPGASPTGSAGTVENWADQEYVAYDGQDIASNGNGMDMATLAKVLGNAGLHWQVIGSAEIGFHPERLTAAYIRAWLRLGYPLIIATAENAVDDLDLGGSPYSWDTTNLYHIIVATGFDGSAILCHDTASIAPDGVRPGPRRYDANKLEVGLTSATAVVMPWLARPQGDFDPIANGGIMPTIPQGWKDDGATLTAPNGFKVVHGFRDAVLHAANWDAGNVPRENEHSVNLVELHNPDSGSGTQQIFRDDMYLWTAKNGVHTTAAGDEIKACYDKITAQAKQIADLQAQLKVTPPPVVSQKIDVTAAIAAAMLIVNSQAAEDKAIATLKTALGIQ